MMGILPVFWLHFMTATDPPSCRDSMFQCQSGECIQRVFVCDGTVDCISDGYEYNEEQNCTFEGLVSFCLLNCV